MDSETIKAGISLLSAVVAVVSAVLAYRAMGRARRDLFDGLRDQLILQMVENDTRCEHIALQTLVAVDALERIKPQITSEQSRSEHSKWVKRISELESLSKSLAGRRYTAERLDELKYTEDGLTTLRRMTRGEQAEAKLLSAESYGLIFAELNVFIARHEARP